MAKPLPYQIIKGARDLIADRRHWCRWANAQTAKGLHAFWASKEARRFCALGALRRASYNLVGDESEAILLSAKVARKS